MPAHAPLWTRFGNPQLVGCTCGWQCPITEQNPDTALAHHTALELLHALPAALPAELVAKAIAWAHADRIADDRSAVLAIIQDEINSLQGKLEQARADFHSADQHAVKCDEALRQVARTLAAAQGEELP